MTTNAVTPAPAAPRRGWVSRLRGRQDVNLWFWVFVGPFFLGLLLFIVVPILWSVYLSFFESYNTVTPTHFVGLSNYLDMAKDPAFRGSLVTFLAFAAFIVPTTYVLALATAVLVARTRFMQAFFRSVFFLPTACSYVVAALIWKLSLFAGSYNGLLNHLRDLAGHDPIPWLSVTDPPWYWLVLVSARIWLQLGFYMILFLAGLQRISPTLYEAATIDGANAWQQFRYITLPQLRATSTAVILLLVINAFQAFDEFFNILSTFTEYPPYARPPLVYLYYVALGQGQDFGHGSAGAVLLTLIIGVVAIVQGRLMHLGRED